MCVRKISQTKFALGGDITLAVVMDMPQADVENLFDQLWRQIYMFEARFSRFLPKSELSVFNRTAGQKTSISPEFKALLIKARQLGMETDGLYNPFITPALQRAGYVKSAAPGYEDDKQIDYTERRVVEVERLVIGDDWALIPYGTALDLGGCGKGYLADQLSEILKNQLVQGYWLSLGGDIVTMGHDEFGNNLTIGIQDADNLSGTTDWVVDCPPEQSAVATSGIFRRKGQNMPGSWHHIIDPETSKPAETDIRLATVFADSAVRADVLASCAIILGSVKALAYLKKHGVKSAILQCVTKRGLISEKVFGTQIRKKTV